MTTPPNGAAGQDRRVRPYFRLRGTDGLDHIVPTRGYLRAVVSHRRPAYPALCGRIVHPDTDPDREHTPCPGCQARGSGLRPDAIAEHPGAAPLQALVRPFLSDHPGTGHASTGHAGTAPSNELPSRYDRSSGGRSARQAATGPAVPPAQPPTSRVPRRGSRGLSPTPPWPARVERDTGNGPD